MSEWPALTLWNEEYLIRALGPTPLTMATTPNGRADALVPGPDGSAPDPGTGNPVFALPMESKVDVATFYQCLRRRDGASPVPYLQYQNSSLSVEAPQLLADVAPELGWASEAFGEAWARRGVVCCVQFCPWNAPWDLLGVLEAAAELGTTST